MTVRNINEISTDEFAGEPSPSSFGQRLLPCAMHMLVNDVPKFGFMKYHDYVPLCTNSFL